MQIVISDFISFDGVAQAPGGANEDVDRGFAHGGWSHPFFDIETMGAAVGETMEHTRALLFGRRTWQLMAGAWPGRAGDPFADQMNSIDKYVLSRSQLPGDVTWTNSHLVGGDDPFAEVAKLRESGDGFLQVMGSLSVAQELIKRDLVDEYRLMVEPITLGGGKRLFPDDGQARTLQLVSSTVASTGVLICTYRPVGS